MLEDKYVALLCNMLGGLRILGLTVLCSLRYIGLALAITSTVAIGE